jgi:hypothetical protein
MDELQQLGSKDMAWWVLFSTFVEPSWVRRTRRCNAARPFIIDFQTRFLTTSKKILPCHGFFISYFL